MYNPARVTDTSVVDHGNNTANEAADELTNSEPVIPRRSSPLMWGEEIAGQSTAATVMKRGAGRLSFCLDDVAETVGPEMRGITAGEEKTRRRKKTVHKKPTEKPRGAEGRRERFALLRAPSSSSSVTPTEEPVAGGATLWVAGELGLGLEGDWI